MDILIEQLQYKDADKLFKFELENRNFFEKMVPSRGDDYYDFEIFKKRHQALLDEQAQGLSYFYLIKNISGEILGRMNLVDIDKSGYSGHVGYRVGESYTGKGIAYTALKLLIETVSEQGIKQLLAKTTNNNIASQKVLEKNGFEHIRTDAEEIDGQNLKFVYYMWTN
ncbi:GNAT family N-acetyltransferase [Gracilibacillus lacisalsi]|uniref:GNAT family N-acetyltransferase n=1 Tax=Gracilibacillus lacisalsi TaxID=393087 RepID=UPI00037C4767|nr:GNAT family N-acetyltransferase [Gracilibacillus lacisalsi]